MSSSSAVSTTAGSLPAVGLSEEQRDFAGSLRQFFERRWPEEELRAALDGPTPAEVLLWREMAEQQGLQGLTFPERFGGGGFSSVESALVLEEMGRVLLGGPYFASVVLAANALLLSGDEDACAAYLPRIASGETTATLWTPERGRRVRRRGPAPFALRQGGEWLLSGALDQAVDGADADVVLVVADVARRRALFAVSRGRGMRSTPLEPLDGTRRLARVDLDGAPALMVGRPEEPGALLTGLEDLAGLALAAEAVGGAGRCVQLAVEHVRTREQFGRPIGSFQAVKHRCADMQVRLEAARAMVRQAAAAHRDDPERFGLLAPLAKVYATRAYFRTAADTIQLLGGIGFTWEHPAHLHLKRAKAMELTFGSAQQHRRRIADSLLGPSRAQAGPGTRVRHP